MIQEIEIIVSPRGETRLQTKGFAGASCREASKFIEESLGQRIREQMTTEFHQSQPVSLQTRQQT